MFVKDLIVTGDAKILGNLYANGGSVSGGSVATQSAAGLMSAADKIKLDGVASGANNYTHPSTHEASMITAGTFAGQVIANSSGQTYNTSLLRNTKLVSSDTDPTVNGEICWTYK